MTISLAYLETLTQAAIGPMKGEVARLQAENTDLRRRCQIAEYTVGRQDEMITSLEDEISQLRLARHAELDEFRAAVGSLR